ncbi:hypothetical protein OG762_52090 (plasmid) [Streptomyces sp. NBC_01136]|uniref:hypothetical protein n=1 Tax=Streptomyces sp. NBC_01136 TaxID=2903754 RepID=UPI002F9176EE|nr:hypothetical protein OG762_52090 [Streptomyces sp. NBC_01136]
MNRYELPPAVGKSTDPRWPAFAERHGLDPARPVQWEVEAHPGELHLLHDRSGRDLQACNDAVQPSFHAMSF